MVIGNIGADQEDDISLPQVLVSAGRAIAAKRALITRDGARHAKSRVSVIILRAEAELDQFAKCVELFRYKLSSADHGQGIGAVFRLDCAKPLDQRAQRLIPADARQLAVLSQQGMLRSIAGLQCVVLGKTLWAQLPQIDFMDWIAANTYGLAFLDADKHAATDGTIAAGRGHPPFGNLLGRGVAMIGIGSIRVLIAQDV